MGRNIIRDNIACGIYAAEASDLLLSPEAPSLQTGMVFSRTGCNSIFNNGNLESSGLANAEIYINASNVMLNSNIHGLNTILDDRDPAIFPTGTLIMGSHEQCPIVGAEFTFWGNSSFYPVVTDRFDRISVNANGPLPSSPVQQCNDRLTGNTVYVTDRSANVVDTVYAIQTAGMQTSVVETILQQVRDKLDNNQYTQARDLLQSVIDTYGSEPQSIEAYYQLLTVLSLINAAPEDYESFMEKCEFSASGADSSFACFLESIHFAGSIYAGHYDQAMAELDSLMQNNPESELAMSAELERILLQFMMRPPTELQLGKGLGQVASNSFMQLQNNLTQYNAKHFKTEGTVKPVRLPVNFKLSDNYPNPFNPSTRIGYELPKTGHVTLKLYNLLGREVKTIVDGEKQAGSYIVDFNAGNLPSGVYMYRLTMGKLSTVKKLILMK